MRIAQVNHNLTTTDRDAPRPVGSHVGILSDELAKNDHQVDLFAAAGSVTLANLVAFSLPEPVTSEAQKDQVVDKLRQEVVRQTMRGQYDVVHSHLYPSERHLRVWQDLSAFALICAVQHNEPRNEAERETILRYPKMPYIAFSNAQANRLPVNWLGVVHHGIDTDTFRPQATDQRTDKALVIGKIYPGKGTAEAASAAIRAGMPVNIAGPILDERYFKHSIVPLLETGQATYLGPIGGETKRKAYAEAAVSICATRLPETFCLVLAESAACGTPVATLDNGACPEVIDNGLTGYVVESSADLAEAAQAASLLGRDTVREVAVKRFGIANMVHGYERIYAENM